MISSPHLIAWLQQTSRKLHEAARNDAGRRLALFSAAATYATRDYGQAVKQLRQEYAVAEKIDDATAMSADLTAVGDVLLEAGKPAEAQRQYTRARSFIALRLRRSSPQRWSGAWPPPASRSRRGPCP